MAEYHLSRLPDGSCWLVACDGEAQIAVPMSTDDLVALADTAVGLLGVEMGTVEGPIFVMEGPVS